MLIKSCLDCKFHEIVEDGGGQMSRCIKENCYSQFSKCVAMKALNRFLDEESSEPKCLFSALNNLYSRK